MKKLIPAHDRRIFAEFADEDCPRCILIRRVELVVLLIAILLDWLT